MNKGVCGAVEGPAVRAFGACGRADYPDGETYGESPAHGMLFSFAKDSSAFPAKDLARWVREYQAAISQWMVAVFFYGIDRAKQTACVAAYRSSAAGRTAPRARPRTASAKSMARFLWHKRMESYPRAGVGHAPLVRTMREGWHGCLCNGCQPCAPPPRRLGCVSSRTVRVALQAVPRWTSSGDGATRRAVTLGVWGLKVSHHPFPHRFKARDFCAQNWGNFFLGCREGVAG